MFVVIWSLLVLRGLAVVAVHSEQEYCYTSDNERTQRAHFSVHTAYKHYRDAAKEPQFTTVSGYEATKIWMLNRHGTRLPTAAELLTFEGLESLRNEIIDSNAKHSSDANPRGSLCDDDLRLLKEWNWDRHPTVERELFLSAQGWDETKALANEYKKLLPNLFDTIYDRRNITFRYTMTERIISSFKAFAEALYGEHAYEYIEQPSHELLDTLINGYLKCDLRQLGPDPEDAKFKRSTIFTQLVADVSSRLGLNRPLTAEEVFNMHMACRFEQSWHINDSSAWCTAFSLEQIKLLEYLDDLIYYYTNGYGIPENIYVACAVVADMLKHLRIRDAPKVIVNVVHSTGIRLFATAMGIAKDTHPLRADNYASQYDRKWRSGKLFPNGAHFVVIKYSCHNQSDGFDSDDLVQFTLNDKPIHFDWCESGICRLDKVLDKYERYSRGDCASIICKSKHLNNVAGGR